MDPFEFMATDIAGYFVEGEPNAIAKLKEVVQVHRVRHSIWYSDAQRAFEQVLATQPNDPRLARLLANDFNMSFQDYAKEGYAWLRGVYDQVFGAPTPLANQ